jgi:hypothetical protein
MAIDINQLALLGIGAVIIISMVAILAQVGLSYLAQRNQNDILAQGLQAVVGTNTIETVDRQMDDNDGN